MQHITYKFSGAPTFDGDGDINSPSGGTGSAQICIDGDDWHIGTVCLQVWRWCDVQHKYVKPDLDSLAVNDSDILHEYQTWLQQSRDSQIELEIAAMRELEKVT